MRMISRQTIAPDMNRILRLPGKQMLSPYFQMKEPRKEAPGRNKRLILVPMTDFLDVQLLVSGSNLYVAVSLYDQSTHTYQSTQILPITASDVFANGLKATVVAAVNTYASNNSLSVGTIEGNGSALVPPGLINAPQAAIANAPADAVTNYNVLTTILGTLVGAVNTANSKQNDIATKLNTLLAELRTLGLIST